MNAALIYVVGRLKEWGRHHYDKGPGWPSHSAIVNAFSGRGTAHEYTFFPDHLQPIDKAVTQLEPHDKTIIMLHYTKHLSAREKAQLLNCGPATFWRQLESAHWAVHHLLDT